MELTELDFQSLWYFELLFRYNLSLAMYHLFNNHLFIYTIYSIWTHTPTVTAVYCTMYMILYHGSNTVCFSGTLSVQLYSFVISIPWPLLTENTIRYPHSTMIHLQSPSFLS